MKRNVCWNTGYKVRINRQNRKKRAGSRRAFAILLACLFLFSGCGKREKLEEDMSRVDTDISSDSDAGKETVDIPEHLTYTLGTSGYKFNVDADVTAAGYQNVKVYEQNPGTVDDEYLKNLAEHIFDDGEYEVIKPYNLCSMEELQEENQFLQELYEEAGKDEYPSWKIDAYIDNYNEENVSELPEGTLIYHYYEETFEEGTIGFESCTLRGLVDGNMAELRYQSTEGESGTLYVRRYVCDHVYKNCNTEYELASTLYGENSCNLEEASRTAQDIIDNMGYTDMKQLAVQHRVINDGSEAEPETSIYLDGYRFIFVRETDGIENILGEMPYAVIINDSVGEDIDGLPGACQEFISVEIDSTGVVGITFGMRYERGEQLSDQPSMLSFEQVDAIAQDYMNDKLEFYNQHSDDYTFQIVAVRLGYVTLLYDTQYTLVPVWVYVKENDFADQTLDSISFGVNALDGSIVLFEYDNVYGNPSENYFY